MKKETKAVIRVVAYIALLLVIFTFGWKLLDCVNTPSEKTVCSAAAKRTSALAEAKYGEGVEVVKCTATGEDTVIKLRTKRGKLVYYKCNHYRSGPTCSEI